VLGLDNSDHPMIVNWPKLTQSNLKTAKTMDEKIETRCKTKPVVSPPGYHSSRLLIVVNTVGLLLVVVVRRHLANRMRPQFSGLVW